VTDQVVVVRSVKRLSSFRINPENNNARIGRSRFGERVIVR
jgi:hypothetical protein